MKARERIALIGYGSFSHINGSVGRELRRAFSECDLMVIDVADLLFGNWKRTAAAAISALRRPGPLPLLRRMDPRDSLLQTPAAFRWLRREIQRVVTENRCLFTFQTQSMWDGSTPGVPHFVYTDHTELANLGYPGFDRRKLMPAWWLALEKQIYHRAERVFTMSSHVSRSLREDYGLPRERIRCVHAGPNSGVGSAAPRSAETTDPRIVILFVGVDWLRKGGPELTAAFLRLRADHPSAVLKIVGCRPKIDLPGCEVLGRVPLDQMPAIYSEASIFCLPTKIEPFGIAFVEAMQAGLPMVGTTVGAVPDMIKPGVNGSLVPPGDVDALHAALDRLLRGPECLPAMGQASRELAARRYDWRIVGDRIGSSIRQALEGGSDRETSSDDEIPIAS